MQILLNTVAIFLRVITNSLSNVFQKKLATEGENPVYVNFINYLLLSLASLPMLFFIDYSCFNLIFWKYAILGAAFGTACNCFMILALQYGELSVLGPINSYKAIVGMIFGIIILHEIPNLYGILGIILIVIGSYFIFDSVYFEKTFFSAYVLLPLATQNFISSFVSSFKISKKSGANSFWSFTSVPSRSEAMSFIILFLPFYRHFVLYLYFICIVKCL